MSDDLRERPQEMFTERQVNKILKSLGARLMSSEELRIDTLTALITGRGAA